MGRSPGRKLIVKNSFLELVDETSFPHDTRNRSFTDGALEGMVHKDADAFNSHTGSDYYNGGQLQEQHSAFPGFADNGSATGPCIDHQMRLSHDSSLMQRENGQMRGLPLILENSVPSRQTHAAPSVDLFGGHSLHPQGSGPVTPEMLATLRALTADKIAQCNSGNGQMREQPPMMPLAANMQYFQVAPNQIQHATQYPVAMASQQSRHESGNQFPRKQMSNSGLVGAPSSSRHQMVSHSSDPTEQYTTVMLRNLPNKYTRAMLLDMLDVEGFTGKFTFVYLPIDFKTHAGLGYAFVDLTCPAEAQKLRQHFEGFSRWVLTSDKVCTVSWSHPEQQGHAAHVERYRNSPVMHDSVPEDWKPVLFVDGRRVPFPLPTRKIRPPRLSPLKPAEKQ